MAVFTLGSLVFGWGADYRAKISGRDGCTSSRTDSRDYGPEAALRLGAVWACVRLLSETVGTLPMGFYQRAADGGRSAVTGHPLYKLLHDSPNADQTAAEFWESVVAALCTTGNFFAEKVYASDGRLIALEPFRTGAVAVTRDRGGARVYRHTVGSVTRPFNEDQIFHVRGFGVGGDTGLSPISYARDSLGLAMDTDVAARSAFQNGMRGAGFLVVPGKPTPDQKKGLRETFIDPMIGADATARAGILEQGMDWKEVKGMPPEDLQLIEGRAFNVEELCRWFRVPPFMIGHTEKSTSWGTGLEQQMIGFLTFSLRPYLTRIEQAVKKQLLTSVERERYYAEFNLEGLLRADSAGRAALYTAALGDTQSPGWMVRNEVRRLENMPPVPGWDEPIALIQQTSPAQPVTAP